MSRIGFLHALLVVTFSLCLAWSAEARKRSSSYQGNGFSVRFGEDYGRNTRAEAQRTRPEVRRTRLEGRGTRAEDRSTRTAEPTKVTDADPGRGALNAAIDRLVRACYAASLRRCAAPRLQRRRAFPVSARRTSPRCPGSGSWRRSRRLTLRMQLSPLSRQRCNTSTLASMTSKRRVFSATWCSPRLRLKWSASRSSCRTAAHSEGMRDPIVLLR